MIDPDGHMFIQGPQADVGGDSYHVKPTQHNVPKGSSYEPTQRQSVYIAPPKKTSPKPAAVMPASGGGGGADHAFTPERYTVSREIRKASEPAYSVSTPDDSGVTTGAGCVSAGGGVGAYLQVSGCIAYGGGKIGLVLGVYSGAEAGLTASAAGGVLLSNARDPSELSGLSLNAGGSIGEGLGVGFDQYWAPHERVNATSVWGGVTAKTPLPPAEAHFGAGGSWVPVQIDLIDVVRFTVRPFVILAQPFVNKTGASGSF
jgi:hypothetical protein